MTAAAVAGIRDNRAPGNTAVDKFGSYFCFWSPDIFGSGKREANKTGFNEVDYINWGYISYT